MKALGRYICGTMIKSKVPNGEIREIIPIKVQSIGKEVGLWRDGTVVDTILVQSRYLESYENYYFFKEDDVVGEIK